MFAILSNLQTKLFRIGLPENGLAYKGCAVNPRPITPQGQLAWNTPAEYPSWQYTCKSLIQILFSAEQVTKLIAKISIR